jgi:uncharacterized spore protein YtfJ
LTTLGKRERKKEKEERGGEGEGEGKRIESIAWLDVKNSNRTLLRRRV